MPSHQALLQLTEKWQRDAAQRFKSANLEPDSMGRLLIEHGAVCLYNCITEVRHLMGLSWPDDTPQTKHPSTPCDMPQASAIKHALRTIGLALCASDGCVATDMPDAQVSATSWRIDHNPEMAQLAVLEKALGMLSTDTGS